ncbi:Toll/interleukin-1 receptor homology (TIR) domain and Leucine-rich repeat and Leucine-rich repeat, typical subtype-containing protein [Strongyloides ratti]|uniref:Toll/interleukin-1 receptor homology (TIR) domain and Leucine-rich repeat and Leucine-rich repeat, typical subtype-containing protein n=1 Tax=Strongyloides ratti TaxID=34506 RepID=A0A090LIL5_STRRB|nr:Toll/interleukin-1 receptor homology (TIR) domain and Leucine-rich repeat and Leucine-rich repeat, typical subtype-containing protein [Strongyloides ratti]CEF67983.1 Toll/interleukin-1 receptor homology (TIR) domain and Leucine-rich repeat and Leucine-rich repeat, typical subtype-containing protein [Strongyloides ratti]
MLDYRFNCPERCLCIPDALEIEKININCRWEKITQEYINTLPANVTKSLSIYCHNIYSSPTYFEKENNKNKNIFNRQVEFLRSRKGPFELFTKLRDLRINNCSIVTSSNTLSGELFYGLESLRNLYLDHVNNPNTHLPVSIESGFLKEISQLEKFSLTQSNVVSFSVGELCNVGRLQILNVSHNLLEDPSLGTEACLTLKHLAILDMNGNKIKEIKNQDFSSFFSVQQLILSNNLIEKIEKYVFKNIPLLQHLEIHNNQLREIPELGEKLLHLNLAYNKIQKLPFSVGELKEIISLNLSSNMLIDNMKEKYGVYLKGKKIENLDLSGNKFTKIPFEIFEESFEMLTTLDVSRNNIRNINSFGNMTHLQSFDLSHNKIEELKSNSIDKCNMLQDIILTNNSIHKISPTFFDGQKESLISLDLSLNLLLEVPISISNLNRIKYINVSHNQITNIPLLTLSKLGHLTSFDTSYNRLSSIDSFIFSNCRKLKRLYLKNNRITQLSKDAFKDSNSLSILDISNNYLDNFGPDGGAIEKLKNLRTLDFSNNLIEILNWNEIPPLLHDLNLEGNRIVMLSIVDSTKINVKKINLKNNRLLLINGDRFPKTIEEIDLGYNLLKIISSRTFVKLPNLKLLNLKGNHIEELSEDAFIGSEEENRQHLLGALKLYIGENPLKCSCKMTWILKYIVEVPFDIDSDLYYMQNVIPIQIADASGAACFSLSGGHSITLSKITKENLVCPYAAVCEPECVCCDYGNCDCNSKCPDGCSCYHSQDFSTNIVTCNSKNASALRSFSPKDIPVHATHVYLKNLMLPVLRSHDFLARFRLKELSITESGIKRVEKSAFNTLVNLESLDLSDNLLEEFDSESLPKAHKLRKIYLSKNEIRKIDPNLVNTLPQLNELSLENNQFTDLPYLLEDLSNKKRLQRVSISNNPFRCDCNQRFKMQYWLVNNQHHVSDYSKINCVENVTKAFRHNDTTILTSYSPNFGSDLFIIPMMQFMAEVNKSICVDKNIRWFSGMNILDSQLLLIILIILFIGICLAIFCFCLSLLTRNRRCIDKKGYKKGTMSLNCSTTSPQSGCSPLPPSTLLWSQGQSLLYFDLFVSYSKADEIMVCKTLCGPLDDDEYTMALLHRDGPRYNGNVHQISDELNRLLECSQTLLLVLTKNFIQYEWNMLQIKTSHQLFFTQSLSKSKRVIAVLDEDVTLNDLDEELGQILRKSTYIRMRDPLFWNLFRSALPSRSGIGRMVGSPTPLSDCSSSQHYSDMYGTNTSTTGSVPSHLI